jgi:anthranilate phosphoribosyltransferase
MLPIIALLADGKTLPYDMAVRGFQMIMNGGATQGQIAAFLMAMRIRGESVDEITAGAVAMRAKARRVTAPAGTIDTCGTGGDARGTYNISTAVAFVLAACGVPVAKHGNRSVSSLSGSSDVLAALGVKVDASAEVAERCLRECGICFLSAPVYHTAMRHVAPVRQELGVRTIFNILGPLSNPAAPDFQLLGVYSPKLVEKMAYVLKQLGVKAAWVVHGHDGLDELSITGVSSVAVLKDGEVNGFEVSPEDAGLPRSPLEDLKGKDPAHNAEALRLALSGLEGAYRNAIVYNAAAGLMIAGLAADLKEGAAMAAAAIDDGRAHTVLQKLVMLSNEKI